jgi:hypothetical protein
MTSRKHKGRSEKQKAAGMDMIRAVRGGSALVKTLCPFKGTLYFLLHFIVHTAARARVPVVQAA